MLHTISLFATISYHSILYFIGLSSGAVWIDAVFPSMVKYNVLCVKIFQSFANTQITDNILCAKMAKYTDNVEYCDDDICYNTLQCLEITEKIKFKSFVPINSGMISLVFRGETRDGKQIVIKLKRKKIQKQLFTSIDSLEWVAFVLKHIPIVKHYHFDNFIYENINIIQQQLDFLHEIDNMNAIKENAKHMPFVVIPNSYRTITEKYPNVICVDFIDGKRIHELDPCEYAYYLDKVIRFVFVTCFIQGKTHGDLHAGNIFFIPDGGKIGIIDFGITYDLTSNMKNNMMEILMSMFENNTVEISKRIIYSGIIEPVEIINKLPIFHVEKLNAIILSIITPLLDSTTQVTPHIIYSGMFRVFQYIHTHQLNKYGDFEFHPDFFKLQMVIITLHNVVVSLSNGKNIIRIIDNSVKNACGCAEL